MPADQTTQTVTVPLHTLEDLLRTEGLFTALDTADALDAFCYEVLDNFDVDSYVAQRLAQILIRGGGES